MKIHGVCLFVLLTAIPALAVQPDATPPGDSDEELARKIKDLNGQIQELRAKQDKLANEQKMREDKKAEKARLLQEEKCKAAEAAQQQELARLEAAKKKHYAKVEIRGNLGRVPGYYSFFITINQLNWRLDFGTDKELLATALRYTIRDIPSMEPEGRVGKGITSKEVIVTGRFVNTYASVPGHEPQIIVIVESITLVEE
jgi:hypothetical protein